jgi:hypothetical protein
MKILYLSNEREAAWVAEDALRATASNATLTWAQTPGSALGWAQENRDAAAVIVEADVHGLSGASFVEQVRDLGLTAPVVVVVASAQLEWALGALNAGADGYVLAGPSLQADLPRIVAGAIDRERGRRADLAGKLTELGAACDQAAALLADVQARHGASLAREARICTALQQRLLELESALRNADERQASEAVAFADQLAKRHSEFMASLADTVRSRDVLAGQLSAATAARDEARLARRAHEAAAAEHLRRREAELGAALEESAAARSTLEGAVAEAQAAHQHARQRAELDLVAANERQAALEDLLAQEADRRTGLDQELAAAADALQEANDRYTTELSTAAGRLADVQARYDVELGDNARARAAFEQRLADAATELERGTRERTSEAAVAAEHLVRREAELGAQLAEVTAARETLERALTEAQSAHQDASNRAAADLTSAAERRAALDDLLAQQGDRSRSLEQQLAAAETARHDADHRHMVELAEAAMNLDTLRARHDAAVVEHAASRSAFEQQLIDAVAARQQADQRGAAAVAAATAREAEAVERLTTESAARASLEHDLAGIRTESARGRHRSLLVVSASRRRTREQKAWLEAQHSGERADADRTLREKDEQIRQTQEQLRRVHSTVDEERQTYARARLTSESELQRLAGEYGQLRLAFDQLQAAFQALEHVAGEHAAERARLGSVVAERDAQLSAQAERHLLAEQVAHDAVAQLTERLRQTLEASGSDIARLQREMDVLRRELDATRTHAEALRGVAVRVPDLQAQLELSEKERRGQFERAPYALCRCTQAGVITDANHAFAMLLGRRRADQLRNMDFAAAVFDRAGDVGWLLERTRTMRKAEPVETCWKTPDGRHLIVRLQALATTTGLVEIVVEDITGFRALEDRLRQAQRLEAVGRLASEVAVTCDALLRDVARDAHEWLATIATDDALRTRGQMLLADLARAAGFLRKLGAYGDTQVRALEPVSVQRVLRDLAPVLTGVAGDRIELVLPKASGAFDVDVEAERVERVLVNVASYARERMPHGGQVRIDLATTVIGRRFIARYPNIRPGPHVLITVTEQPRAGELHGGTERGSRSPDKPGVDLGALVDLIGTCGGHLWMEAQPAGNMMVKIHLPKPAAAGATDPRGPGARADRRGRLARWFRATSAAVVRS